MARGEETRRRIVDTALQTIGMTGLARMSIGDLAQATGMSKSGLFAHFGSRDALEVEIVAELARRFTIHVIDPALTEPDPEAILTAVFDRWMGWIADDEIPGGCPVILAMSDGGPASGPARDLLMGELDRLTAFLGETYRAAGGRDPELFTYEATGLIMAFNANVRLFGDTSRERPHHVFSELLARHLTRPATPT